MSELRTEEEQLELIRNWWKENGKSLILGVAVAAAAVVGWKAWQRHQQTYYGNASALYQGLVQGVAAAQGGKASNEQLATYEHVSEQLKKDYTDTSYARFAALLLGKVYADAGQLDKAQSQLQWVHDQESTTDIGELAELRLARVLFADKKGAEALGMLQDHGGLYAPERAELRGDILSQQGKAAEARQAYQEAQALYQEAGRQSPVLAMKLDDLAVAKGA